METKVIVHYWSDQSAGISGEPPMRDKYGYPITVYQAKKWCKEHGYEYYVVEAAGDYGSYVSEKSEGAKLPRGKKVETWDEYRKRNTDLPDWVRND